MFPYGPLEVDEMLVGGKTRGEDRGVHHNIYIVGVVEFWEKLDKRGSQSMYAGCLRLQALDDRTGKSFETFATKTVLPHSHVTTGGWSGYSNFNRRYYPMTTFGTS